MSFNCSCVGITAMSLSSHICIYSCLFNALLQPCPCCKFNNDDNHVILIDFVFNIDRRVPKHKNT